MHKSRATKFQLTQHLQLMETGLVSMANWMQLLFSTEKKVKFNWLIDDWQVCLTPPLSFPIYQFKELQGWKASRLLQINLQINIIITSNFYSSSVYLSIYLDENFKTMGEQAVLPRKEGSKSENLQKDFWQIKKSVSHLKFVIQILILTNIHDRFAWSECSTKQHHINIWRANTQLAHIIIIIIIIIIINNSYKALFFNQS